MEAGMRLRPTAPGRGLALECGQVPGALQGSEHKDDSDDSGHNG